MIYPGTLPRPHRFVGPPFLARRDTFAPFMDSIPRCREHGTRTFELLHKRLKHQHAVTTPNHKRVTGEGHDAPLVAAPEELEIAQPVLEHARSGL